MIINIFNPQAGGSGGGGSTVVETTITSTGWTAGTLESGELCQYYTLNDSNIKANSVVELNPSGSITQDQRIALRNIFPMFKSQTDGSISFWAYGEPPSIEVPIQLVIINK